MKRMLWLLAMVGCAVEEHSADVLEEDADAEETTEDGEEVVASVDEIVDPDATPLLCGWHRDYVVPTTEHVTTCVPPKGGGGPPICIDYPLIVDHDITCTRLCGSSSPAYCFDYDAGHTVGQPAAQFLIATTWFGDCSGNNQCS